MEEQKPFIKIKPKIGRNAIACGSIAFITALFFLGLLFFALAETGLFYVPIFSRFYGGPVPTRLVRAEPMSGDAFRVILGSRFLSQALQKKEPPYTAIFSEAEATGVLMNVIDEALRDRAWKQAFTQIVIRPTDFELFCRFERSFVSINILARFEPKIENGGLRLEPVWVQIGDYRLPVSAAYHVAGYIFARDFGIWKLEFGENILHKVSLSEGKAEVTATIPQKK